MSTCIKKVNKKIVGGFVFILKATKCLVILTKNKTLILWKCICITKAFVVFFFFLNFVSVKIETELVEEKEKYEYKLCRRKLIVEGK